MRILPESLCYEVSVPNSKGAGSTAPVIFNIDIPTESPLQLARNLSERVGVNVWFKREDLRPWKAAEKLGGKAVLVGASFHEAKIYAKDRAQAAGRTFVHSFGYPHVIAGQRTIGMEILRQNEIFEPIGGGGLIVGVASYVKMVCPEVKIIGVEPYDANAMALSLHHGQRIMLDQVGGFADGVAVKVVGEQTSRICQDLIDGVVLVSRDAICMSIKDMIMIMERKSILEPAGALALAGAEAYRKYYGLKGENVVSITSGANMDIKETRPGDCHGI